MKANGKNTKADVCPDSSDTDLCECGEPKKTSHRRCKKCRQRASYALGKSAASLVTRVIPITRSGRELAERAIAMRETPLPRSGPGWVIGKVRQDAKIG